MLTNQCDSRFGLTLSCKNDTDHQEIRNDDYVLSVL